MKILREGKALKPVIFDCHYCDCLFEATALEYGIVHGYDTGSRISHYRAYCPHCKNVVFMPWDYDELEDDEIND